MSVTRFCQVSVQKILTEMSQFTNLSWQKKMLSYFLNSAQLSHAENWWYKSDSVTYVGRGELPPDTFVDGKIAINRKCWNKWKYPLAKLINTFSFTDLKNVHWSTKFKKLNLVSCFTCRSWNHWSQITSLIGKRITPPPPIRVDKNPIQLLKVTVSSILCSHCLWPSHLFW